MKFPLFLITVFFLPLQLFPQRDIATMSDITATSSAGNKIFFSATAAGVGTELFVTGGIRGDATLVKDINPGPSNSNPYSFKAFNGELFFIAYSTEPEGYAVWRTDGTSEGTEILYRAAGVQPRELLVFKNQLYFTTDSGLIFRTDGISTPEVFFQSDYSDAIFPIFMCDDNYIFFQAYGSAFYRSDGSSPVEFSIASSEEDLYFRNLFVLGDKLIAVRAASNDQTIRFYAIPQSAIGSGNEESEWQMLKELKAPPTKSQSLNAFVYAGGKLFFNYRTAFDVSPASDELWVCDGTAAGTKQLKSFGWSPHSFRSGLEMFFVFQNKLFFRSGQTASYALWTSDGSVAGTVKLHDVVITAPDQNRHAPVAITEDKFYFSASDNGIWSSDGTTAGTRHLFALDDASGAIPHDFVATGNTAYFVTSQAFSATLWSTARDPELSVSSENLVIQSHATLLLNNPFEKAPLASCITRDVTIKNVGLASLYLNSIQITGKDFYLLKSALPESLAPGSELKFQIVYNPVTAGFSTGTLTVMSNDGNESEFVTYLKGNADTTAGPICALPPDQLVTNMTPAEILQPIVLSASGVPEAMEAGTLVGEFVAPANASFSLTAGEGDADNRSFAIESNKLKSAAEFDFATKNLYTIRVQAVTAGETIQGSFRIRVINRSEVSVSQNCETSGQAMSFSYTSIAANSQGHFFVTTTGGNILRSKDGGNSWEVVYWQTYGLGLTKVMFIDGTGYATGASVLLKTDDGGETWFRLFLPGENLYSFFGFGMHFFNNLEGYISSEDGYIFFTEDGGHTWDTRMSSSFNEFRNIYFLTKDTGYASVSFGDLMKTTDGGRTWSEIDLSSFGFSTRVRDMIFFNSETGFMLTDTKLLKTVDGGQSWNVIPTGSNTGTDRIQFINENVGFLYGATTYRSTDGGNTWNYTPSVPGTTTGLLHTADKLYLTGRGFYEAYGAERAFAVSTDEGSTWDILSDFSWADLYRVKFSSPTTGIIIGETGMIKTQDGGLSWRKAVTDLSNVADIIFIDENEAVIVSMGHIYKSDDGGVTTREVLHTPQETTYRPAGKLYNFYGVLYAVSWYAIYRSTDEGETWSLVSVDPAYYTQGMHFTSASIGYRVELFGDVQKTTDGGETWAQVYTHTSAAAEAFNAIFFLDEQNGFKGGEVLERTHDGGVTWQRMNWQYHDITAINFRNPQHGYVVSRAGYVYETSNAGTTWEMIYDAPDQIFGSEFAENEIYLVGENGFAARLNLTSNEPNQPGYIYGPAEVCAGASAEFRLSVDNQYQTQWTSSADNVRDNVDRITLNFPVPGEYAITATHVNACKIGESRTKIVVVTEPATSAISGPDQVKGGEQGVAYSIAEPVDGNIYFWNVTGGTSIVQYEESVVVDWGKNTRDGEVSVLTAAASGCRNFESYPVEIDLGKQNIANRVNLYPNPSESDIHVQSKHANQLSIRLIDGTGREYFRATLAPRGAGDIPGKLLKPGVYFLEVSDGRNVGSKKIVRK